MTEKQYQRDWFSSWKAVLFIAGLIVAWGILLSVGVLVHPNSSWIRAIIITGSVAVFVGFWIALAAAGKRR